MRTILACLLVLLAARPAHAHFFVEPGFGFELGRKQETIRFATLPTISGSSTVNGITFGGAFGYRYNLFFLGAQAERGLGSHLTDFTGYMGYNIMIRLRLWAGYIFSAKDDISNGSGMKVGLGYAIWHLVSLNGEYASRNYNQYTGPLSGAGLTYSGKTETFKITITLPSPRQPK